MIGNARGKQNQWQPGLGNGPSVKLYICNKGAVSGDVTAEGVESDRAHLKVNLDQGDVDEEQAMATWTDRVVERCTLGGEVEEVVDGRGDKLQGKGELEVLT